MELKVESRNLLEARKNLCDQARIGFSFHFRFPLSIPTFETKYKTAPKAK